MSASSGPLERIGTAIVGAGVAGLAAAWRLLRAGEDDVVLFELETRPGGTAAYGTDGVVPYPWGAHYLPVPGADNPALIELLLETGAVVRRPATPGTEAGVEGREAELVREPEERLFVAGSWHEGLFPNAIATSADLAELERFQAIVDRWVAFRDGAGRRAFALPMRRSSRAPEVMALDAMSAARFLAEHGFRSSVLRWYLEYACRDDYGSTLEQTSAWALLFYFAARVPEPGAASAPFLTWPEGNGRLVRHLRDAIGPRLRCSELVLGVSPDASGVALSTWRPETHASRRYVADRVVLAVPTFVVTRLIAPWRTDPPPWASAFTYGSWLVANLHLHTRPDSVGAEPAWDNVLYESQSLGYVIATHQRFTNRGPTIWTYYQPLCQGDPEEARRSLIGLTHAQCAEAILGDLERAHPNLEACLERLDVWRWGHAMVRPIPGLVSNRARAEAQRPLGRVHFAHSDLSGLALFEEAFDHGVRAAEEVLQARGRIFTALWAS